MDRERFGFLTLTIIFTALLFVPTLLTGIASAHNSSMNYPSVAQPVDNPGDHESEGTTDPRFGQGRQIQYAGTYVGACDRCDRCVYDGDLLRCDQCAVRDYDRCELCAVREQARCDGCNSEYRCDLRGCGWVR